MTTRRAFLTGLTAAFAAPAIIPIDNLMRVRGIIVPVVHDTLTTHRYVFRTQLPAAAWRLFNEGVPLQVRGLVTFDAPTKEAAAEMFREWNETL